MAIDLELYRKRVRLPGEPPIHLSVIDIAPERPVRTLVFLHGFGGRGSQWRYQLHEFSISNRVIAIDQRGHGESDRPVGRYDMPQLVNDLEDTLKVLKVDAKFVLVGHSFGGAVATEYAAKHPDEIEHLFLIATAGEFRLNPIYHFLLHLPATTLRLAAPFVKNWLSAPPQVMHSWFHQNLEKWNGWSLFRSLGVPTTVIHGHHDRVFSKPLFEEVARAIPDAEEIDVGASGHLVMLERREAVNRAIKRALEKKSVPGETRAMIFKRNPAEQPCSKNAPGFLIMMKVSLSQSPSPAYRSRSCSDPLPIASHTTRRSSSKAGVSPTNKSSSKSKD